MITNKTYNTAGELVSRTVTDAHWTTTQVRNADGSWWNITIKAN